MKMLMGISKKPHNFLNIYESLTHFSLQSISKVSLLCFVPLGNPKSKHGVSKRELRGHPEN